MEIRILYVLYNIAIIRLNIFNISVIFVIIIMEPNKLQRYYFSHRHFISFHYNYLSTYTIYKRYII